MLANMNFVFVLVVEGLVISGAGSSPKDRSGGGGCASIPGEGGGRHIEGDWGDGIWGDELVLGKPSGGGIWGVVEQVLG